MSSKTFFIVVFHCIPAKYCLKLTLAKFPTTLINIIKLLEIINPSALYTKIEKKNRSHVLQRILKATYKNDLKSTKSKSKYVNCCCRVTFSKSKNRSKTRGSLKWQ